METLLKIDYSILHFINVTLGVPAMDIFWLSVTSIHKNTYSVIAFTSFILVWGWYRYGWKMVKPVVLASMVVGLADAAAYRVIKSAVERPRPIHNPEIASWLRPVGDAHGTSFPSNHAANVFAGAFILSVYFRRGRYYFYTFATIVALSRVGLGVHYPSDILVGALVGTGIAAAVTFALRKHEPIWDMEFTRQSGKT